MMRAALSLNLCWAFDMKRGVSHDNRWSREEIESLHRALMQDPTAQARAHRQEAAYRKVLKAQGSSPLPCGSKALKADGVEELAETIAERAEH
jgi:hypothetical protein